jgi:hypothetical protein
VRFSTAIDPEDAIRGVEELTGITLEFQIFPTE